MLRRHILLPWADLLQQYSLLRFQPKMRQWPLCGVKELSQQAPRMSCALLGALPVGIELLRRPLSIGCVRDGHTYELSAVLALSNLFLRVGQVDELFIKVPSERGLSDYRRFTKLAQSTPEDIRAIEEVERFEKLESTLHTFSDLKPVIPISAEFAHYLAVHKVQYERLQTQTAVGIPRARFGLLRSTRLGIFRSYEPALFQERVPGTTLWDMFDFEALRVMTRWQPFVSTISAQLSLLLDSGLREHVDWNIKNFVFDEARRRLFYVDLKPTTFVAKQSNEHNLTGIRDYFIV